MLLSFIGYNGSLFFFSMRTIKVVFHVFITHILFVFPLSNLFPFAENLVLYEITPWGFAPTFLGAIFITIIWFAIGYACSWLIKKLKKHGMLARSFIWALAFFYLSLILLISSELLSENKLRTYLIVLLLINFAIFFAISFFIDFVFKKLLNYLDNRLGKFSRLFSYIHFIVKFIVMGITLWFLMLATVLPLTYTLL